MARTIADLADAGELADAHVAEAVQYRSLDRTFTAGLGEAPGARAASARRAWLGVT